MLNKDVESSRRRISRRRALAGGGTLGLGAVLAACGVGGDSAPGGSTGSSAAATSAPDVVALLDTAGTCGLTQEETQGPYYFDVDSIRSDIREDRPGTALALALRVQDAECRPVPNSVVEIWHCDAGGVYSGFESASGGGDGPDPDPGESRPQPSDGAGAPPDGGGARPDAEASGDVSDGSYSVGEQEATTTDDGTYLRGAQVAGSDGIVTFTTIYPGWYSGRTVHIHLKVHPDKQTVLTSQLYFDEGVNDAVFATSPYDEHTGRDTRNDDDSIYDDSGLLTSQPAADGYVAVVNLGIDV